MVLGVLGRSVRLYPVRLHAFVFLSNHYHLLVSVDDSYQLARFMNYLNSNLAREAGRLHGWQEKFWGRRYQAIVISEEEIAQVSRLRYLLSHGCKEGLVARPRDWLGANSVNALVEGQPLEGIWINRSRKCAARARGEQLNHLDFVTRETIKLDALPCWQHLEENAYRHAISEVCQEIEKETADRHSREGIQPLGSKAILAQQPHDRPEKLKRSSAPAFHAATKAARRELVEAYGWFLEAFRAATESMRRGVSDVRFPQGSFPSRLPYVYWEAELSPG